MAKNEAWAGNWPRASGWPQKVTAWLRIPAAWRRSRSCRWRGDCCTPTALGAARWQDRVLGELARVRTHATPRETGPVLTAAEQRVADLVAAGRTNPEIAA